jgi:hypothetical protein
MCSWGFKTSLTAVFRIRRNVMLPFLPYGWEAAMHVQASRPKIVAPPVSGFELPVTSMLLVTVK